MPKKCVAIGSSLRLETVPPGPRERVAGAAAKIARQYLQTLADLMVQPAKSYTLQVGRLLERPAKNRRRVQAQPIVQHRRIDRAEVGAESEITALLLVARLERRIGAVNAAFNLLANRKSHAGRAMV